MSCKNETKTETTTEVIDSTAVATDSVSVDSTTVDSTTVDTTNVVKEIK
jgi:hypothetical protein